MKDPQNFPNDKLKDLLRVYKMLSDGDSEHQVHFFEKMQDAELEQALKTATEYYQVDNEELQKTIIEYQETIQKEK